MNDAVDQILEHWGATRPDLDVSAMAVTGRLSRLSRLLERGIREYFVEQGVEPWEFDILITLRSSGPAHTLTPGQLAATTMIGASVLTYRVDRLVAKKLVTRETDPANRRRVLVTLTSSGADLVERLLEGHVANEQRLLAALDGDDRDSLASLLRRLLVSLGDTSAAAESP